jgi:hypothetical protein
VTGLHLGGILRGIVLWGCFGPSAVASACDGVGVQTNYARYIHYKQSLNAKEAVAGFLWAAEMVERPQLARIKK